MRIARLEGTPNGNDPQTSIIHRAAPAGRTVSGNRAAHQTETQKGQF
jgi:hypothetical protein